MKKTKLWTVAVIIATLGVAACYDSRATPGCADPDVLAIVKSLVAKAFFAKRERVITAVAGAIDLRGPALSTRFDETVHKRWCRVEVTLDETRLPDWTRIEKLGPVCIKWTDGSERCSPTPGISDLTVATVTRNRVGASSPVEYWVQATEDGKKFVGIFRMGVFDYTQ